MSSQEQIEVMVNQIQIDIASLKQSNKFHEKTVDIVTKDIDRISGKLEDLRILITTNSEKISSSLEESDDNSKSINDIEKALHEIQKSTASWENDRIMITEELGDLFTKLENNSMVIDKAIRDINNKKAISSALAKYGRIFMWIVTIMVGITTIVNIFLSHPITTTKTTTENNNPVSHSSKTHNN